MKLKKTPQNERGNYKYTNSGVVIKPNENGVTEKHISALHSFDDSEVRNNLKNLRCPLSDKMKEEVIEWAEQHPGEDIYSYIYNISFDEMGDNTQRKDIEDYAEYIDVVPWEVEHLREIVEALSDKDKKVYDLVLIKGYTYKEAAEKLSVSERTIGEHVRNIRTLIIKSFKS